MSVDAWADLESSRAELDRDLDGVLAVDAAIFTNPWTRDMYEWELDALRRRARLRRPRRAGAVVAFCAGWVIFDELHINTLAVDPAWRRRGVASALLTFVLQAGGGRRRPSRDARGPAVERGRPAPLRTARVRRRGRPHRYYREPDEDALILWRNGPEP